MKVATIYSLIALALAGPAIACVQFDAHYVLDNNPPRNLPCPKDSIRKLTSPSCPTDGVPEVWAALTDNGHQVCQLGNNRDVQWPINGQCDDDNCVLQLDCIAGYSASIDWNAGPLVHYSYGSFSGSFGVSQEGEWGNLGQGSKHIWANTWGC
jgi:hypothetical protein